MQDLATRLGRLITVGGALLSFAAVGQIEAQTTSGAERDLVRPESDQLPREPHGRHLSPPTSTGESYAEVARFSAIEARQGVAVDHAHFYAVANSAIGKYDRHTGEKVAQWRGERDGPIIHLNSCTVAGTRLICAHSNHPGIPMLSSVEIWDTRDLSHIDSYSFGQYEGSLTWALPAVEGWWAAFVHYANYSGVPGRGPEWSSLVHFDSDWNRGESFAFPVALIDKLTPNSSSGGSWGADGRLYVTGHDDPELYVLRLPQMGSVLEWVDTYDVPMEGQAWVFDPADPRQVWGIVRSSGEVVVGQLVE